MAGFSPSEAFPELGREQLGTSHVHGALLEIFVYMECLKHLVWAAEEVGIYHFRDKQQNELDLVLERSGGGLIQPLLA